MARTVLGANQVQGLDYAYTIQGWLNGVNSTATKNGLFDIANDGLRGIPANPGINSLVARDAYGYSLNYFSGDYIPINSSVSGTFAAIPNNLAPIIENGISDGVNVGKDLFNGNIRAMLVNIPKLVGSDLVNNAQVYGYRYDQLNRIVAMNSYNNFDNTTNTFSGSSPTVSQDYKERISYDANGNILTYLRNGALAVSGLPMDKMSYQYPKNSTGQTVGNQLRYVLDDGGGAYTDDIKSNAPAAITDKAALDAEHLPANQAGDNYQYDLIGNLIKDGKENITSIEWTVYGKIKKITKVKTVGTTSITSIIQYTYDASGNRISKDVDGKKTFYVRDASGNVMSVYQSNDASINNGDLTQIEIHLYGSSRLGIYNVSTDVQCTVPPNSADEITTFIRGNKFFELSNHLGNVLVTITDRKIAVAEMSNCPPCTHPPCPLCISIATGNIAYYTADVVNANDYYPFGMLMPGRKYKQLNSNYRCGFNGKENDDEVKGEGNQQDYGMRIYDPRLGKFLSVDPLTKNYPMLTPYSFAENDVIRSIDLDGLEKYIVTRLVDNRGVFRGITIQAFTDENGNARDNEAYKRKDSKLQKADVYTITRNINTGNQVGAIAYSGALTRDQQIVYNNLNVQKDVKAMIAEDRKENPSVDGEHINDINQTEGPIVGNKWKDGKYNEATFNTVVPIPVQFPGGSSTPTNTPTAINQLAPVARILNLFPTSTATVVGNTGNGPGDNSPTGNSPAVLNQPARLNGNNNSSVGATMRARANTVRRLLNTNFGINLNRTTPATGVHSPSPAGRNVTIRINGINL